MKTDFSELVFAFALFILAYIGLLALGHLVGAV